MYRYGTSHLLQPLQPQAARRGEGLLNGGQASCALSLNGGKYFLKILGDCPLTPTSKGELPPLEVNHFGKARDGWRSSPMAIVATFSLFEEQLFFGGYSFRTLRVPQSGVSANTPANLQSAQLHRNIS